MAHRSWRIVHSEASLGWGGQEHRVMAELSGFQRRGSEVWLIAPTDSEIFQRATAQQIPTEPLRLGKMNFLWEVIRLARWLRKHRIEVVNTHSSRDGWLVGLAARLARVPLIIRTRHIDVDYPNRWLSRHAFTTFADHVLTTSHKIKVHFQEMFSLPDKRISVVPTGIDLKRFCPEGVKAGLLPERAPGLPLIGMISVLRSWKGHSTFLDAARILNESGHRFHFVIVGGGAPLSAMEKIVQDHGATPWVALAGHREDVPEVLRALDVLVIASTRHEGVPQIGLQALATKTPVIGSDVGGIPEIIRPGETGGIFPAGDAKALATAIQETMRETEATRKMADAGRKLVESNHSLEKMFDELEMIYRHYLPA